MKLEALNVKNNRPDITNYDEAPSFYNTVYILDNSGLSSDPANKQYYRCFHYTSYDPNISGRNEVSKYKCYNQYGPTGENGFFIWLKANYGTATQIGIVPNPGANSIPLPNYMGGNEYDIIYSISAYKGRFVNWYVRMETYPNGYLGPRQEPLKIDLVISRPSN
ncbi:hypothetical protein KUH03_23085 [Sphingobacterium sp. E70]|uniref:hypothetical protein n=1 Tax=Sphingobacterium sp. E70 TaxID=2853439 RepID=UPI00211BC252|nr:hypothetical protein [Sphingobacterium sp. E70]ULT22326.1 hypothetical protein KUH03_23085 [Sphingobacterium sp. E70]